MFMLRKPRRGRATARAHSAITQLVAFGNHEGDEHPSREGESLA
jgi:hypothetical protein